MYIALVLLFYFVLYMLLLLIKYTALYVAFPVGTLSAYKWEDF
jgi:hypothetical protein